MYIEIEKELIPYKFEIEFNDEEYTLEINHNQRFDFFTVDLFYQDKLIVCGEKLVLDRQLFENIVDVRLPNVKIIPKDRSKREARITYENMNQTVFLYVED